MTEAPVHLKQCRTVTHLQCGDEQCDWCVCNCAAPCAVCESRFFFKSHPDPKVREDGPIWTATEMDQPVLCRWCWLRTQREEATP